MWRPFLARACALALGLLMLSNVTAAAIGLDPAFHRNLLGPARARGAVVWNHGRSLDSEDYLAPTPPYLRALRDGGWDVFRFDRLRDSDTLSASSRRLVAIVTELKHRGYRRIVLAGQSFGAFLALMAADEASAVDAVIATAPAAFGDFQEFYDTWRLNAARLYPLLDRLKRARDAVLFPRRRFRSRRARHRGARDFGAPWAGLCRCRSAGLPDRTLDRVERGIPASVWRLHSRLCRR